MSIRGKLLGYLKTELFGQGIAFEEYVGQSYDRQLDKYVLNQWYTRGPRKSMKWYELIWFVLIIPLHFSTFIHEMGHYLAGKLAATRVGLEIGDVVIGRIDKEGYVFRINSIPLYVYPKLNDGASGFVQFRNMHWFRWWTMFIAAAGPILQFLFFFCLAHAADYIQWEFLKIVIISICCFGMLTAALNFSPIGSDALLMCKLASKRFLDQEISHEDKSKQGLFKTLRYTGAKVMLLLQLSVLYSIHSTLWKALYFLTHTPLYLFYLIG